MNSNNTTSIEELENNFFEKKCQLIEKAGDNQLVIVNFVDIEDLISEAYTQGVTDTIKRAKEEERQRIIDLLTSGKGRETGIWHYELNDHSEMEASYTGDYLSLKEVMNQLTNPKESNQ